MEVKFCDISWYFSIILVCLNHAVILSGIFIHERLELELMLQRGVKFEIEALSVHSLSFLSKEYIPSKIQGGVHI